MPENHIINYTKHAQNGIIASWIKHRFYIFQIIISWTFSIIVWGTQMYTNNAYLNNSTIDRKDKSKPLVVTMCGAYKLYTHPKLPTWRPRGRVDFQLIFIAAGKAHSMMRKKRLFMLVIWFYTVQKNHRNMNIMPKTRSKFTGFILQETMSLICSVPMDWQMTKGCSTVVLFRNISIFSVPW